MGFWVKTFVLLLLALVIASGAAVLALVDSTALVAANSAAPAADLRDARAFLRNADPRNLEPGEISSLALTKQNLELLLNYVLDRLHGGLSNVQIREGQVDFVLSARLPDNPLGSYLNVQFGLSQLGDTVALQHLQIGKVSLPGWLADAVMQKAHRELKARSAEYAAALAAVQGFSITDGQINVIYQLEPELLAQISSRGRALLISDENRDRLIAHTRQLAILTNDPNLPYVTSLSRLLGPMFAFAGSRGGDAVEENRAAIVALALYVMRVDTTGLLGVEPDSIPPLGRHRVTLSRRYDSAQHFSISAGLSVGASSGIAEFIGQVKELDDSENGGSGFSFTDMGMDRSGVRFARLAVSSSQTAVAVQQMLASDGSEATFLAEFGDLPESMTQEVFVQQYGGVGQPAYNQVVDTIESRINAVPLFSLLEPH